MGTSQSSRGSPSGDSVPMVPPWVPTLPAPTTPAPADADSTGDGSQTDVNDVTSPTSVPSQQQSKQTAPDGRFLGARRAMGDFGRRGSHDDMRRGVGHYVSKGYGGGGNAVRRFGGTVSSAGNLFDALSSLNVGYTPPGDTASVDRLQMVGKSAEAIIDAVIQAAAPINGTQDVEANRAAMKGAMSEVLKEHPDADLMELSDTEKALVIERFVAIDVFNRIDLDIGMAIQDAAPSAVDALNRLEQVRNYVKETVAAQFRELREAGKQVNSLAVREVTRIAIAQAIEVFESYVE